MCMCVCVWGGGGMCVCERDRQTEAATETEKGRHTQRKVAGGGVGGRETFENKVQIQNMETERD